MVRAPRIPAACPERKTVRVVMPKGRASSCRKAARRHAERPRVVIPSAARNLAEIAPTCFAAFGTTFSHFRSHL
jgi:hypothetical protein